MFIFLIKTISVTGAESNLLLFALKFNPKSPASKMFYFLNISAHSLKHLKIFQTIFNPSSDVPKSSS